MRTLTLNEKITLKGLLAKRGVPASILVKLDMREAVHFWYRIFPSPISMFAKAM